MSRIGFAKGNLLQFSRILKKEVEIMESPIMAELYGRPVDKMDVRMAHIPLVEYEALMKIKEMIKTFDADDELQKWRDVK